MIKKKSVRVYIPSRILGELSQVLKPFSPMVFTRQSRAPVEEEEERLQDLKFSQGEGSVLSGWVVLPAIAKKTIPSHPMVHILCTFLF